MNSNFLRAEYLSTPASILQHEALSSDTLCSFEQFGTFRIDLDYRFSDDGQEPSFSIWVGNRSTDSNTDASYWSPSLPDTVEVFQRTLEFIAVNYEIPTSAFWRRQNSEFNGQWRYEAQVPSELGPSVTASSVGVRGEARHKHITSVNKGLSIIRKRPKLYLGGHTATRVQGHDVLLGLVCDFGERVLSGEASTLDVASDPDGIRIEYDAGIPHDFEHYENSKLELLLSSLYACLDQKEWSEAGQLCCHGQMAVLTAVAREMTASTTFRGVRCERTFRNGCLARQVDCSSESLDQSSFRFVPDPAFFDSLPFEHELIEERFDRLRGEPFDASVQYGWTDS